METPAPRRVLLVVTGGIACYKACEVARELHRLGAEVQALLTAAATRFVAPLTFEALTGRRVYTDLFPGCTAGAIDHIRLGREADVVAVVPATADFLARLHAGLADDLATATLLALPRGTPVVVAPSMNREMWSHPVTRRNLRALQDLLPGFHVVEPVDKELACGEYGPGGLPEPPLLACAILERRRVA